MTHRSHTATGPGYPRPAMHHRWLSRGDSGILVRADALEESPGEPVIGYVGVLTDVWEQWAVAAFARPVVERILVELDVERAGNIPCCSAADSLART